MSEEKNKPDAPEAEGPVIELGDRILIQGGRFDGSHGRVYYRDAELIRLMPDGASHMLIDLPLDEEGEIVDDLGVDSAAILEKRTLPAFTQQQDLQKGQFIRTFRADGTPGPNFTVLEVDTGNDSVVLKDESGSTLDVDFGYVGISRETPFAVIRTAPLPSIALEEEGSGTQAAAAGEVEVPEEKPQPLFKILGKLAVPVIAQIRELPSSKRIYPDMIQRADMIQDMLRLKTPAQQKNPNTLVEIRRLVELCLLLRNEIVEYSADGTPDSVPKTTSVEELIDLLKAGLPLARPVLDANRTIYVDSTETSTQTPEGLTSELLYKAVNGSIAYLKDIPPFPPTEAMRRPAWLLQWQGYLDRYFKPWSKGRAEPVETFKTDQDFFRHRVPDIEIKEIPGLVTTERSNTSAITVDFAGKVTLGIQRGLAARRGRPTTRGSELVTSADEAALLNYILFPFTFMRSLGPTRSGSLLTDSLRSQESPATILDVLREKNGVGEIPTADSIIAVGPDGSTLGNIELAEYLSRVPVGDVKGYGDFEDLFIALGLTRYELNSKQLEVLVTLLEERNAVRKASIGKLREKADALIKQEPTSVERAFTDGEVLVTLLRSEPEFMKALMKLKSQTPLYEHIDLAQLAFLRRDYQDYVEAVVGGRPLAKARERIRVQRDAFQEALRITNLTELKKETNGRPPVPNTCVHVKAWTQIQKVKDTTDRMRLLVKFVNQYKGYESKELTHYNCTVCKQHLLCKHEFLLLQEFLHPQEHAVLHKELLLNYSGGEFQGKYICRICGQKISDIDYDNSLEYDDNGRPMIGRAVLVDQDAIDEEEIDDLLGAPADVEDEINFEILIEASSDKYKFKDSLLCGEGELKPSTVGECIYNTAKQLFARLGIDAKRESYIWIVQSVHAEIMKLADRETYMKQQAAQAKKLGTTKGAVDYDVYINRRLIGLTANYCLIDIQCKIPDYLVRSSLPGCRATFSGYPRGKKEDDGALEYLSCAVASITKDKAPWNMTGWLRIGQDKKRQVEVQKYLTQVMERVMEDATVQQLYVKKERYTIDILGKGSDEKSQEKIPDGFLPTPYVPGVEVTEGAEKPNARVYSWIRKAHDLAKTHTQLVQGSPYSETTCCFTEIEHPGRFWVEQGFQEIMGKREPPVGSRGSRLVVHYVVRRAAQIKLESPKELFSRVFLNVCFRGSRKGLPHEPGFTGKCPWCEFQFPEDPPDPPLENMKPEKYAATIRAAISDAREQALVDQEVKINDESFADVLDASHLRYQIPAFRLSAGLDQLTFFRQLRDLRPAPYENWVPTLQESLAEVEKVMREKNADLAAQAAAWTPLVDRIRGHEAALKARIGEKTVEILKRLCGLSPIEVRSQLTTYFIVPFRRILTGFSTSRVTQVLSDYDLAKDHKEDIKKLLVSHVRIQQDFADAFEGDLLRARAEELCERLSAIVAILYKLRFDIVRIGGEKVIEFIVRGMVFGAFAEYADLNRVPISVGAGAGSSSEASVGGVRKSLEVISRCAARYEDEARKYSEVELREALTRRAEKEKLDFIARFDKLNKEERQLEKMKKQLGIGEWARGKNIHKYSEEQYEWEKEERARAGIIDFPNDGPAGPAGPAGRVVDAFGFEVGGGGGGGGIPDGEGDDHAQQNADDY